MKDLGWIEIIGGSTIFGSLTTAIGWFFFGKNKQKQEIKRDEIDNEIKEIDYAEKVRDLYESILVKKDTEIKYLLEQAKEEREYFRSEITPLREEVQLLRNEVANLKSINGTITEAAEDWEKKFKVLEKEHDKLKKDFETLRKSMK